MQQIIYIIFILNYTYIIYIVRTVCEKLREDILINRTTERDNNKTPATIVAILNICFASTIYLIKNVFII